MNCYVFLGIPWKVHYVMAIEKLYMKFIQCDYIIYNIVVLALYHCHQLYLITWPITKPKILQKFALWQHFMNNGVCSHPTTLNNKNRAFLGKCVMCIYNKFCRAKLWCLQFAILVLALNISTREGMAKVGTSQFWMI